MNDLWYINDKQELELNLHRGQKKAWVSEARFVTVCAGTQSGKTSFGPAWLYREIQNCGPGDYIIAAPTYPLLSLKALPEFRRFFEEKGRFGRYVGSPSKTFTFSRAGARRIFGFGPDVDTKVFFGHAQDPDSLESATAKAAWLDEAGQRKFRLGSWQAIMRRLSLHRGRALITTTPYSAFGWLKDELYDRWRAGDPQYDWVQFESIENPFFSREEWERAQRDLPVWKFNLFYRGQLTRPSGMIYDAWRDEFKVKPFEVPDDWPRFLGIDFGGVNTAGVFLARNPESGVYYLYREYAGGQRTARDHVKHLLHGEPGTPLTLGGARSEGQWRQEFRAAGLPVRRPPIADVEVGILHVYGLIASEKLRVFDTCERTLEDITTYSRALDENDEPTEEIEEKSDYHFADALRYIATKINRKAKRAEVRVRVVNNK